LGQGSTLDLAALSLVDTAIRKAIIGTMVTSQPSSIARPVRVDALDVP
jgi:hypothetical protein